MKKTNREIYLKVNKEGLNEFNSNKFNYWSYYTSLLQIAYDLGWQGVDLSDKRVVKGWRFGKAPVDGISVNHVTNKCEKGLSLACVEGCKPCGSSMFFLNREKYKYEGLLVATGSDDEPVILPFGFDVFD